MSPAALIRGSSDAGSAFGSPARACVFLIGVGATVAMYSYVLIPPCCACFTNFSGVVVLVR